MKIRILMFFFKNGIFFEYCTDCTDFFRKLYGLYGFLLKMYGFLYGFVQKSFGHPESLNSIYYLAIMLLLLFTSIIIFVIILNKLDNISLNFDSGQRVCFMAVLLER